MSHRKMLVSLRPIGAKEGLVCCSLRVRKPVTSLGLQTCCYRAKDVSELSSEGQVSEVC